MRKIILVFIMFLLVGCMPLANNNSNYLSALPANIPMPMADAPMPVVKYSAQNVRHAVINFYTKEAAVNYANQQASRYPNSYDFSYSTLTYPYNAGLLYVIYTARLRITDLQFEPGEKLISQAAGDTLRWQIAKTYSNGDSGTVEHLLIKPNSAPLENNLIVMTSKRVYHLKVLATNNTYVSTVAWSYPDEENAAKNKLNSAAYNINKNKVNQNYKITSLQGDTSEWQPSLVFDDGKRTYIYFPESDGAFTLPLLMVDEGNNHYSSTINYRQKGPYMIVDDLFKRAQLILGDKLDNNLAIVQIDAIRNRS